MRFIAAVALLAICQTALAAPPSPVPPKVQKTAQDNAFLGTLVAIQNNLDAPLAPFGRKMNSWLDPNSEFLREQIVKGNALGSIFYGVGFSTPGIVNAAITGNDNYSPGPPGSKTYHGRHLAQATTPDNFNLIPKANVIASILLGYKPNLSPLKDQPMFPPGAFSKAPKPTGTFIPQNDPLLSKQPHGTVPFFNKPDLSLDYPLMKSTVPASPKDPYNVQGYLDQPLHQGDYDKSHPYQADNIEFPTKSYSPKGDYYSPKVDYIPTKDYSPDYSKDSYPVYESPKPYDHTLFQSGQTRKLLQQGDVVQAGYAGSVITGGVAILDALLHKSPAAGYSPKGYYPDHDKSYYPEHDKYDSSYPYESPKPYHDTMFQGQSGQTRRLQQGGFPEELVPGRGGLQNTGNKIVQDNALGSLVNKQGSGENGKLDREALLGFQQGRN